MKVGHRQLGHSSKPAREGFKAEHLARIRERQYLLIPSHLFGDEGIGGSLGASLLERERGYPALFESESDIQSIPRPSGVDGQSDLVINSRNDRRNVRAGPGLVPHDPAGVRTATRIIGVVEQDVEGFPCFFSAGGAGDDGRVILGECLDIQADPVDEPFFEEGAKARGISARGVQSDGKSEVSNTSHCWDECQLTCRFPAGEDDAVK